MHLKRVTWNSQGHLLLFVRSYFHLVPSSTFLGSFTVSLVVLLVARHLSSKKFYCVYNCIFLLYYDIMDAPSLKAGINTCIIH
jgi:hypothetical protein